MMLQQYNFYRNLLFDWYVFEGSFVDLRYTVLGHENNKRLSQPTSTIKQGTFFYILDVIPNTALKILYRLNNKFIVGWIYVNSTNIESESYFEEMI